jgi:Helix-turn-helix domain
MRSSMDIELTARLDRIEGMLVTLVERQVMKDWYSTEEFAQIVSKAEFTVREWCRLGRIRAEKRRSGRGAHPSWVISHQELMRYQREGLIPIARANSARA